MNGTSRYVSEANSVVEYVQDFKGISPDYNGFVPSFHAALPLGERTTFGFSMVSPYGLATDWYPYSPVRYAATYSEVLVTDMSPELGVRLTDHFAFGAGLDLEWTRIKLNQMFGAPTLLKELHENQMLLDSLSYNKGSSYGVGFHVGVMGIFNDAHTRIGINYQSKVRHVLYGHSRLIGPLANNFNLLGHVTPSGVWQNNDLFSNPAYYPDVLALSAYQHVNERLALLGSVIYTGWHVIQSIQLNNAVVHDSTDTPSGPVVSQAAANLNSPQNFRDTWTAVIGANYYLTPKLMFRSGFGYEQTPTTNSARDVRLPDQDHWIIELGAHYQWRANMVVDIGYAHAFAASTLGVHSTIPFSSTSSYTVDSHSDSYGADAVAMQFTWVIDKTTEATK